ncbi:phage tail tape measure protein [Streptomyces sp. TRM66268-LWL]|uniref:Phage tail tape measure protein n=1 Tax=Streptomyces polyasparticus TaxID=2767826 RepID=A0ABR7STD3_9ACTN|nr:phage tail tape measure protein [Streptomyces polyasparticus]MBC9717806.1 phage tail tape measure protein [Streptomyces polyasparticus]
MSGYTMTVQMQAEANSLIRGLRAAAREAGTLADRTAAAHRALAQLATTGTRTSRQLTTVGTGARRAAAGLSSISTRAAAARSHLRATSRDGVTSIHQLNRAMATLGRGSSGMTGTAAVAGLALGVGQAAEDGNRYQRQMNVFRAVTSATAAQMQRASFTAQELGNDLSLPGSTAADAAEGMVELAKAGFRTDQAIDAVRASLQLSSAAGVNAADSAKYLGDIMDQFGLGADQAARASDILAATANNASGGIIDIYYAMRYAGPVAAGLGVSMEDAASAVGMLGKAGILGQTAGTSLRGMMANLAAPTPQMVAALHRLGIEAWDAQGRFRGLRVVIDGLARAQHDMSQQDFTGAVKEAFGKPAMSGAIAMAHQGTDSFDALSLAVRQAGAAADITSARGEGLSGAMVQLNTQARQTGIALYEGMAPGLEYVVRLLTHGLAGATPHLTAALEYGNDLATLFGPDLKKSAAQGLGGLVDEARQLIGPLKDIGEHTLATGLNLLVNAAEALGEVLGNAADGVEPLLSALSGLGEGGGAAAGTLDIVATAANLVIDAVSGLSIVLVPIGQLVGGLVDAFGSLPGPIQSAALALLLFARARPMLMGLAGTVSGPVRGAFQGFAQQMQVQRQLAATAGQSLTRYGAAWAAVQARVGFLGQMTSAFRSASGAGTTFIGTLNGVGRAATTGLRAAGSGLVGALGGPWGAALAGATVVLGLLASAQQRAAAKAAEHKANIDGLAGALRESNGVINESVRQQAAQTIQNQKLEGSSSSLMDVMGKLGYSLRDVTDSYLGQGVGMDTLAAKMQALADKEVAAFNKTSRGDSDRENIAERAGQYQAVANTLKTLSGDSAKARKAAKDLANAQQGAGSGASAYDRLKTAVGELSDETADADQRTRALKDALDLLSGGQISLQAAKARVNSAVLDLDESAGSVDRAQGYGGKQLVNKDDTLNTTTRNGQTLYTQLTSLSDAAADAAVSAYALAQQNGEALPKALAKSRAEMQSAREAAIKAARGYGLTREQAERVADSLGLLPSKVSLLLQTKGMDSTLANLLSVQAEFDRFPTHKTIRVDSLSEGAQKELRQLGFTVKTVPGTRQIKVTAPTAGARKNLDILIKKLGDTPGSKRVQVSAPTAAAIRSLEALRDKIRSTPGAKSVVVRAPTTAARKELESLGFRIEKVPGSKNVKVTVPTGGARKATETIQSRINALRGRTIPIYTQMFRKPSAHDKDMNGIPDMVQSPGLKQGNGGVVDYYADGGVRERHVAQIAPAGSWRIWGEPETQGEAYVPLALSKRVRSKAVVEDVVGRFGGHVEWFADGGMTRRASRTPDAQLTTAARSAAATRTLADVVRRFEVRPPVDVRGAATRVDARGGQSVQVVVVREQQPLIGTMPVTVHDSSASPQQIGTEMMRRLRNAQRGGRVR